MTFVWTKALMVTLMYVVLDALYTLYTIHIQKGNAFKSALSGAMMYSLTAWGIIIYTSEPIYIVFVAIGSFLGTYGVVKWFNKTT